MPLVGASSPLITATFFPETIMNRQELQDQLVQQMIDDMDLKTMTCLCYDYLMEGYDKYNDEELKGEVEQYYPELLEN